MHPTWGWERSAFGATLVILPVVVGPGVLLSCEHLHAHKQEECFVGNCLAGSTRLLLCILEHINLLGDPLYFGVIALNFFMQRQEVEGMSTYAPHLGVGKKRLWCDVGVKHLCVSEFLHPRILDDGEYELRSLLPHRLVGSAVGVLGFLCQLYARADNGRGIVIDRCIVGANLCRFGEFRVIANCVR